MSNIRGPHSEIPHDAKDIAGDLEFEREVVEESIRHDYSTSDAGIVPLNRRRPLWHFLTLILTFEAGFSYVFVGFTLHDAGYGLAATSGFLAAGALIYMIYAIFSSYLGSRSGQTHTLLTRSILGSSGSWIVSALIAIVYFGWAGFQANLTAQLWDGLYGWGNILAVGVILGAVMVFNNIFGFTGITVWARYVVSPVLMLWILYLVIKGLTTEGTGFLGAHPQASAPLTGVAANTFVIGFIVWGTEPDEWRYAKPRFSWPVWTYAFALFPGFLLMGVGGWIIAQLSQNHSFGASIKTTTEYSLFGAFWLAWIIIAITQVAINDGNYYTAINALQNIIGGWKKWKRVYSCLVAMGGVALAAWIIPYELTNGFYKLAAFSALTAPSAAVIMFIDHFVVPKLFGISRPLTKVPSWREAGFMNIPGVVALGVAVAFGAYGSGLFSFLGEDASTTWGLPAPESWLIAGALYIVGVAITRKVAPNVRVALGFGQHIRDVEVPSGAVVDVASPLLDEPGLSGALPTAEPA